MSKLRAPLAGGLALAAALALAATPVGTWKGKMSVKLPPVPANATPQQKEMMGKVTAMLAKAQITMTLKADKTYTVNMTGMPMGQGSKTEKGKWSQAGNVVTVSGTKPGDTAQKMTLSPDDKTMTMSLPKGQGKIVFTR